MWGLTDGGGLFVAGLAWVLVGVVLARYGPKWAAATAAVPVTISLVAEGEFDPQLLVAAALVLGLIPFVFGYLAAADRNEVPTVRSSEVLR